MHVDHSQSQSPLNVQQQISPINKDSPPDNDMCINKSLKYRAIVHYMTALNLELVPIKSITEISNLQNFYVISSTRDNNIKS